jgi:hypothetical protein
VGIFDGDFEGALVGNDVGAHVGILDGERLG